MNTASTQEIYKGFKRNQQTLPILNYSSKYIQKDRVRREMFNKAELHRMVLKSISTDIHLPEGVRFSANAELSILGGERTRINNRCILSGRGHSVNRMFRLSRLAFRRLALDGQLPGVIKASW